MGKINYKAIYEKNHRGWLEMTEKPEKYESLLAGHYSDGNHFVYELIQNAEDAKATSVVFEYYADKICFYHDGKPFDEADVRGVSSMLETTKADDGNTIGKFGMGFKSVFKYTCEPEIYSDKEAFRIKNYLLPEEIESGWDYMYEINEGVTYSINGEYITPFEGAEHLTKVLLPLKKRSKDGSLYEVDGRDIVIKLKELEPEILLFLSNIKRLLWIDKTKNVYEKYIIIEQDDPHLVICQHKGNSKASSGKYEDLYFLKYKKRFKHPKMENAEVSLAFQTNSMKRSIQKIENSHVWVYFPTKEQTTLPCLLHGSFETAVSREKLMKPSEFNNDLMRAAVKLFAEAVLDFKERGLVTQAFIRQIILSAFNNYYLPELKESITKLFRENALIPVKGDKLVYTKDAIVTAPFDLVDLYGEQLFEDTFISTKQYVFLNDERAAGFTEYYAWLKNDLKVSVYSMDKWAVNLRDAFKNKKGKSDINQLCKLYDFLDDYKLSIYTKEVKNIRKKSQYEEDVQSFVSAAWKVLRKSRILVNAESDYVSAYNDNDEEQVYLSSTSEYHKIAKSAIILSLITEKYKSLLEDSFGIKEFDNFEYVKEKVLTKYPYVSKIVEVTESFASEYANDIIQVCRLIADASYKVEMKELISDRCIVLAKEDNGTVRLMKPMDVYRDISPEGADMKIYYEGTGKEVNFLYYEFYRDRGVSTDNINKLGINTSPIDEGPRKGDGITALGDFRPFLKISLLQRNIDYIQKNPNKELSKKKSACILKLVLENAFKMTGAVVAGTSIDSKQTTGICKPLDLLRNEAWLYVSGRLYSIEDISKNQLDNDIYKNIGLSRYSEQARLLGFNLDMLEQAFDGVDNLNRDEKQELLKKLAKEFGVDISVNTGTSETVFDPDSFDMSEFPIRYIVNGERLKRHIENQFFTADPIRYKEVVIRQKENEAANQKIRKAYLKGMYTNQYNKVICQSCRKIMPETDVFSVSIANYGIEMEQLYLCLCPKCHHRYESVKKTRSDEYKESLKRAIESSVITEKEPYYKIVASRDMSLYFTQTHLAELKNIFQMLDTYGVPTPMPVVEISGSISGGKLDEIVVHDGEMIEYETMDDMKKHQVELDIDKYGLHKEMNGRPLNVVFEYKDRKYRITKKM